MSQKRDCTLLGGGILSGGLQGCFGDVNTDFLVKVGGGLTSFLHWEATVVPIAVNYVKIAPDCVSTLFLINFHFIFSSKDHPCLKQLQLYTLKL